MVEFIPRPCSLLFIHPNDASHGANSKRAPKHHMLSNKRLEFSFSLLCSLGNMRLQEFEHRSQAFFFLATCITKNVRLTVITYDLLLSSYRFVVSYKYW